MNVNTIKTDFTRGFNRGGLYLQRHSPEILLGAGLIGMVVAAVMASKATLKAHKITNTMLVELEQIDKHIRNAGEDASIEYMGKDAEKATVIVYAQTGLKFAQLYGPAAGLGVLSIGAILASHGIMANRQVALIGAYNLVVEGFKNYRARVIEELGEEKDRDFRFGLKTESYSETTVDEKGKKSKVKKTRRVSRGDQPSDYAKLFDRTNPQYRSDRLMNEAFLKAQERYLNDILILNGHVFLNEVYERLGFDHTKAGSIVGWFLKDPKTMHEERRDGYITLGLESIFNDPHGELAQLGEDDGSAWLIDPNVDGVIFELLEN